MSDEKKKRKGLKGAFDKIVMGAIIGGAIGSVLGMGIAPKKGKETRKILQNAAKSLLRKGSSFLEKHEKEIDNVQSTSKKQHAKLVKFIQSNHTSGKINPQTDHMRRIPHEE